MSAPEPGAGGLDEFGQIARLFRPLTQGAPEALGLLDDAVALVSACAEVRGDYAVASGKTRRIIDRRRANRE